MCKARVDSLAASNRLSGTCPISTTLVSTKATARIPYVVCWMIDAFVSCTWDVDLHQSTKDCLEYFFPRLIAGGVLISHDFSILSAVRQAFTEFTADIPENVIELPTTQCMLVKT